MNVCILLLDQWISPVVNGNRPPPIDSFTLTPVTNNTAVMFGGSTDNAYSNKLYMISFTKTSVDILEVPNPGGSVQWPKRRYGHSSVLITTSLGPHLLVVGGLLAYDVWLLDINKRKWKELINLPVNVTRRFYHSLSVWSVTPTTNWIIEFGGYTSCTDTAVIELKYTSDNDWSTSVIPLDQYQDQLRRRILSDWENLGLSKEVQLLRGHLQEREREFYQKQEQIQQDREKEQQLLLQEKATLSQQLDDATTLLEQAEKDKSTVELEYYKKLKIKDAQLLEEKTQVEKKKQIITEDYEKLKLKIAEQLEEKEEQYLKEKQIIIDDNQNLISEKDKVIAKLTSQVEEQSQNEKQIITDLKEKELYIAKLVKERQERVLKQPIKETSSIGLQFNYLIPSMDSLDSSVIIAGQKLFILQGDRSHSLQWEKYGFRLKCPQGAVSKDTEVAVTALAGGNFKVPKGTVLVSAVYAISVSKGLSKPLVIELQHCVDLRKTSQTGCLKFVRAPLKPPYQFSIVEGGCFRVGKRYGSIKREQFSCMGIVAEMSNGDTPSDSESEEGYETPSEGSTDDTHNDSGNGAGETSERTASPINTGLSQESVTDDSNQKVQKVESTSGASNVSNESTEDEVKQKPNEEKGVTLLYTGMMYHEKKEVNQWMTTFSVVRDLEVLQQYLVNEHPEAEKDGPIVSFKYNQPDSILQLCLQDTPSLESGWTVHPDQSPMQIRQCVVDKGMVNHALLINVPSCQDVFSVKLTSLLLCIAILSILPRSKMMIFPITGVHTDL
uniref:Uncharacterized protein n=1 Tax=Amphimedon queenslandica TaxID=400682 RepID=A0A1X7T416_AMPQE